VARPKVRSVFLVKCSLQHEIARCWLAMHKILLVNYLQMVSFVYRHCKCHWPIEGGGPLSPKVQYRSTQQSVLSNRQVIVCDELQYEMSPAWKPPPTGIALYAPLPFISTKGIPHHPPSLATAPASQLLLSATQFGL